MTREIDECKCSLCNKKYENINYCEVMLKCQHLNNFYNKSSHSMPSKTFNLLSLNVHSSKIRKTKFIYNCFE